MAMIDIRSPLQMASVSKLLLKIAEGPLGYIEQAQPETAALPGGEARAAAELARQVSASIISNCVVELWSTTVCYLHALEPDFPLYPSSVTKFVDQTRLPFLSYMSLYYALCGRPFEGGSTYEKSKTLIDMRHELQHDKPERSNDYSTGRVKKVMKWQRRLQHLVGQAALIWLPRVRHSTEKLDFGLGGEPPIMKFMKYPVAKWALEATEEITREMHDLLFEYQGQRKVCKESTTDIDKRLLAQGDPDLRRLWAAGE